MRHRVLCVVGLLVLSGCMVGPDYHRPRLALPASYHAAAGWLPAQPEDGVPKGDWWRGFNDPVLDRLEPMVVENNATVAADYYAYAESQAVVQEVRGGLFPSVGLSGSATRSASAHGLGPTDAGTLEGSVAWTPDIWGKLRRQIQSNVAAAQVSAAELANATLSAQGALAADYVDMRAADAAMTLYRATVAADEHSLRIASNQVNAGIAAPSGELTARVQIENAQAALINAGVARAQYQHAIAVLIGRMPGTLEVAPGALMPEVPLAPVGVPSTLLERRPDIAAAERAMDEANAQVGVAVGAYYPSLSLQALGGYSADPILGLFSLSSSLWSLGADVSATVFAGGARHSAVRAAEFAYDQSEENYRQTVLSAFQDVENDLSNLRILAQQAGVEAQAVADSRAALRITLNEYRAGTVDYTSVVSAQLTLLGDQQARLAVQQDRLLAAVALFQDLGGGFSEADLPSADELQARLPFAPGG